MAYFKIGFGSIIFERIIYSKLGIRIAERKIKHFLISDGILVGESVPFLDAKNVNIATPTSWNE